MTRGVTLVFLVCAALVVSAPAAGDPPSIARLFGCPLDAPPAAWVPPAGWKRHALPSLLVSIALPVDWELNVVGGEVSARAPDGTMRLVLRRGRLVGARRLDFIRRAIELSELGPSYAGPACETRLDAHVAAAVGWRVVEMGYYARPLGGRRRAIALYAGLPDGSAITAVLTTYWGRREDGPEMAPARRILGGIIPIPPGANATSARAAR